jgi:hypothetical protein
MHKVKVPEAVLSETEAVSPLDRLLRNAPADVGDHHQMRGSLCLGTIIAVEAPACVLVAVAGRAEPLRARPMTAITASDVGGEAVIAFDLGDMDRPVVIGILGASPFGGANDRDEIIIKKDRLAFEGVREVVIRCGTASITLTDSGKVLIKGDYVSSRATGTHRVRGGSVQIN